MINLREECEGYYKIEAVKADGSRRILADWFPNLILNAGLDRMASSGDYLSACQVGSGSTAPIASQTSLAALVASTTTYQADTSANSGSSPFFARRTVTFRFAQGVATGVLAEVGVGWASSGSLYSRALILDALGTPTTITVLADESLDVTYELRMYAWAAETSGTISLKGVLHNTTLKSANAGEWSLGGPFGSALYTENRCFAYTGSPSVDISGSPSGTLITGNASAVAASYTPGSYAITINITAGLTQWNNALGIGAIRPLAGWGRWQIGFSPNIMKTSSDILTLQVRHSWGRKA